MKHVVKHHLDQPLARKAADAAYAAYSKRFAEYSPTSRWTSETHCDVTFTVKGVTLRGYLELEPGGVAMDLNVPFLFRPFKDRALAIVEREVRTWIHKAEKGELG